MCWDMSASEPTARKNTSRDVQSECCQSGSQTNSSAVSAPFVPPFSQASSDPRVINVMGKAYDKACKMMHDKGQPHLVQEVIAGRIIEIVTAGERDPDRICERVMAKLGLQRE
jgi:hypothetical protein